MRVAKSPVRHMLYRVLPSYLYLLCRNLNFHARWCHLGINWGYGIGCGACLRAGMLKSSRLHTKSQNPNPNTSGPLGRKADTLTATVRGCGGDRSVRDCLPP
jgi:hypothetical protein